MRVAITHIYRENKILCCKETNSPIVDNFLGHSQPPKYLIIRELRPLNSMTRCQ